MAENVEAFVREIKIPMDAGSRKFITLERFLGNKRNSECTVSTVILSDCLHPVYVCYFCHRSE